MRDFLDSERRPTIASSRNKYISTVGRYTVNQELIMQLGDNKSIGSELMNICFELLRCRERLIEDLPSLDENYKKSIFANIWTHNIDDPEITQLHDLFNLGSFIGIHYIYLPYYRKKRWHLIIIHPEKKIIYFIDPKINFTNNAISEVEQSRLDEIEGILNRTFIQHHLIDDNGLFKCRLHPYVYFEPITQSTDSAVYVFFIAYFIRKCCPVYFKQTNISQLRASLTNWIYNKTLPV